jgi:hypothetical protein
MKTGQFMAIMVFLSSGFGIGKYSREHTAYAYALSSPEPGTFPIFLPMALEKNFPRLMDTCF